MDRETYRQLDTLCVTLKNIYDEAKAARLVRHGHNCPAATAVCEFRKGCPRQLLNEPQINERSFKGILLRVRRELRKCGVSVSAPTSETPISAVLRQVHHYRGTSCCSAQCAELVRDCTHKSSDATCVPVVQATSLTATGEIESRNINNPSVPTSTPSPSSPFSHTHLMSERDVYDNLNILCSSIDDDMERFQGRDLAEKAVLHFRVLCSQKVLDAIERWTSKRNRHALMRVWTRLDICGVNIPAPQSNLSYEDIFNHLRTMPISSSFRDDAQPFVHGDCPPPTPKVTVSDNNRSSHSQQNPNDRSRGSAPPSIPTPRSLYETCELLAQLFTSSGDGKLNAHKVFVIHPKH